MNDDDLELAGAVADGLATDEERQRVAADTELQALAARVDALSAALRDVPPPAEHTRAAALAAATAALDAGPDDRVGAAVRAPTNVVSLATRRRLRLVSALGTAAAVAVVAIGGVVISHRSGDDAADRAPGARVSATTDAAPQAAPITIAPATTAATLAAPAAPAVAATGAQTMEVAAPTVADAAASQAVPAAGGGLPRLATTSDLRAAAAAMTPAPPDGDDALASCAGGSLAPDAVYVIDGVDHRVAIVALRTAGRVGAIDVERCVIVASAPR
jgi:hypothetical protein